MLKVEFNVEKPLRFVINELLTATYDWEPVAFHLVGATLSLRFPNIEVGNQSSIGAATITERGSDFFVGDTYIHLTKLPTPAIFESCGDNIRNGYRSILLVPETQLTGALQNAVLNELDDKVGIYSVESFVGQSVEEMGEFTKAKLTTELRALLMKYNERVAAIEADLSFLIEIPKSL